MKPEVIAGNLVKGARSFTEGLYKDEKNYNEGNQIKVFFEGLILLIHMLDRCLFAKYGAEKRSAKIDPVLDSIKRDYLKSSMHEPLDKLLSVRQEEYANYLWESEDGGQAGTLLWEFSKIIGKLLNEKDYSSITSSYAAMVITIRHFLPKDKDL